MNKQENMKAITISKRIFQFFLLSILASIFVACGGTQPALPTSTFYPTATPQSPTNAQTISPSRTAESTKTPAPIATIEVTLPAEAQILQILRTQYPDLNEHTKNLVLCSQRGTCGKKIQLSPNGEWIAVTITKETYGKSFLNVRQNKRYDVYLYELWPCEYEPHPDSKKPFCGEISVNIAHWTNDSNYVYLHIIPNDIFPNFWLWKDWEMLYKLNLADGSTSNTHMGPEFSFSPNDRYLAYQKNLDLVIFELQTGNELNVTMPSEIRKFGHIVWSPDSEKLIYIRSDHNFEDDYGIEKPYQYPTGFDLVVLNVNEMKQEIILANDNRFLYPMEWLSMDEVILCSAQEYVETHQTERYKTYLFQPSTNAITEYPVEDVNMYCWR